MGVLRFAFGTMGSGKSTLALQIHHNLAVGRAQGLLLTKLDRDGSPVSSRLGVSAPAVEVDPDLDLFALAVLTPVSVPRLRRGAVLQPAQCDQLSLIVDDLGIDVFAFGLITDFRGFLFEGTKRLLEVADERVAMQVEARCWCGQRATHNARLVNGVVVTRATSWSWATPGR